MAHAPHRLPFLFFAEHRWDIPPASGALRPAECRPSLSRVPGPFQRDPELPSAHRDATLAASYASQCAGRKSLDYIAKNHATRDDRCADDMGQSKVKSTEVS